MADVKKTIEILFAGVNNTSGVISDITSDLGGLNSAVADVTAPFATVAESALKAELAVAALGASFLALSVNQAGKFADSFAEVTTLFDATDDQLSAFSSDILDYSRDSVFAFEEITNAGYQAISFGTDYSQSLDVVATAEKLAIGGKADLAASVELLSGTLNAYGLESSEAGRLSDAFFTIVKDGKTTIPELAQSMSKVSGIASAAGIDIETLGAAVAALTATGAPTSEAMTSLKALISNIIKPTKEAADVAAELGIGFNAAALDSKGLEGVLGELYTATGGNIEIMGKLFGSTEALNAALILGEDASGKFAGALVDMENKAGATDAAFEKMADNIAFANQKVVNNARTTLVEIGLPLLDGYRDIADGIVGIFKGISIGIDAGSFDPAFDALNSQAADFADFLRGVAADIPTALEGIDLTGLLTAFESLAGSVAGLFEGVDLTSAQGLEDAIQGVIDAIAGLTTFSASIVDGAKPIINQLFEWAQSMGDVETGTLEAVGQLTGLLAIVNKLTEPVGGLISAFGGVGDALQLMVSAQTLRALGGGTGLVSLLSGAGTAAAALAAPLAAAALAVGSVGFAFAALAEKKELDAAADAELEKSLQRGVEAREELRKKLVAISDATGVYIGDIQDLDAAVAAGTISLNKQTGEWEKVLTAEEKVTRAIKDNENALVDWSDASLGLVDAQGNVRGSVDKSTTSVESSTSAAVAAAAAYYELQGNSAETALAMAKMDEATGKATETLSETKAESDAVKNKLLDLASDERIKSMEFAASIEIAGIEAGAQKITAAFDSITATVTATSGNIGSLFATLSDAGSYREKWSLEEQIEKENVLREDAFKLQERLLEGQIEAQELKNKRAREGGGDISITMEGIYPELEMIMWEIIKRVRLQVIENEGDFLTVAPPAAL